MEPDKLKKLNLFNNLLLKNIETVIYKRRKHGVLRGILTKLLKELYPNLSPQNSDNDVFLNDYKDYIKRELKKLNNNEVSKPSNKKPDNALSDELFKL